MVNLDNSNEIQRVKEWYNNVAQDFIKRYEGLEGEYWKSFEEDRILNVINVKNKIVLDLGCGHGRITFRVAKNAKKVVGLDISKKLINIAKKRQKKFNMNNVKFVVGNATKLPKWDNSFDIVIALGMFEYLQSPSPFLKNINKVLKNNGSLVFTFHLNLPLVDKVAKRYYKNNLFKRQWIKVWHTKNEIINIAKGNGFKVDKIESFGHLLSTILFKMFKMKKIAPLVDRTIGTFPLIKCFPSHGIMFCRKIK